MACLVLLAACRCAWAGNVQVRQLTNDGRSYLEFGGGCAPAGNRIAYYKKVTDQTRELCLLEPDSGKSRTVSDVGYPVSATWSRDGSKLAFIFANSSEDTSEAALMIWDAASGKLTRTAARGQFSEFRLQRGYAHSLWSPDNSCVALLRTRKNATAGLFIVPADGSPATEIAPNNPSDLLSEYLEPDVWSPDASRLTYGSWEWNEMGQVWSADAKGQDLRPLTKQMLNLWALSLSPDGRRIAFTTSEGRLDEERKRGYSDIWLLNSDGSDLHPVTHGSASALEQRVNWRLLRWTRDSRYIICWYLRPDQTGEERFYGFSLIDPDTEEILPVWSAESGAEEFFWSQMWESWADSWDGKRIAVVGTQYTVRGPRGGEQRYEDERSVLKAFSTADRKTVDLLVYRPDQDRERLQGVPSWTSDNRYLVITKARVISAASGKSETDLYLVTVPGAEEAPKPPAPASEPTKPAQLAAPEKAAPVAAPPAAAAGGLAEIFVRNRRVKEVADLLPAAQKGNFTIDEGRNSFLVPAEAANLASLKECVAALDNPVPHIMVNVLVTELSKDANKELGLDWEFARHRFGGILPIGDSTTPGSVFWQGVGRLDDTFLGTLSALAQKGKATVRANPRVLATSGKEASITIRRTDFFLFVAGVDYEGRPVRSRSDISADTVLKITPVLLGGGRISVRVDATVDSFTFAGKDDLPDTTRRQAVTEVVCGDGESIVIGGLTQEEKSVTVQKTPLLGDLPILGEFFRHTQQRSRESTLVIFITPNISTAPSADTGNPPASPPS